MYICMYNKRHKLAMVTKKKSLARNNLAKQTKLVLANLISQYTIISIVKKIKK